MDKPTRQRLKALANEGIVATFGENSLKSQLAEALEQCVDELDERAKCAVCGDSENPDWPSLATALEGLGFRLEPL